MALGPMRTLLGCLYLLHPKEAIRMSLFGRYEVDGHFDEMFSAAATPRPGYERIYSELLGTEASVFESRHTLAERSYLSRGITFSAGGGSSRFLSTSFPASSSATLTSRPASASIPSRAW